ncbi:hypothetical protein [Methanolobus sp. WCC5]|uniref:hypothetical protein n=1 Tax=Methanolobus sp. WCC5 TaxID=3125785 RepID=UPI00324A8555
MKDETSGYGTVSEVERKYFPKAYEKRHFKQLMENPEEAGKVLARKLVAEMRN